MKTITILCEIALLAYHQLTTYVDFHPFNGARNYSAREKLAEGGINLVLMSLAPIGFALNVHGLMVYGVVYYCFLLVAELIIWWIPYLVVPTGPWRSIYNASLACVTSDFGGGDTLTRWYEAYKRLHTGTVMLLPRREGRPAPNVEHTILHGWTFVTAIVTTFGWYWHE